MIKESNGGVIIQFRVQPNSSKNLVVGKYGDRIKIKLQSPPVDGKANECLIDFLSDLFEVSKSKITLVRGETSREKAVHINGCTVDRAEIVLGMKAGNF